MNDKKIRKLVLAALLAALVCVATMVVQIPSPMQGYVNLGDCFVLLSGWLLGPGYGAAAAGIGSMLVDLLGWLCGGRHRLDAGRHFPRLCALRSGHPGHQGRDGAGRCADV